MAPAIASVVLFTLILVLPYLCSAYETSHVQGSQRFTLRSSNDRNTHRRLRTLFAGTPSSVAGDGAAAPAPAPPASSSSGVALPIIVTDDPVVPGTVDYSVMVGYGTPPQQLPMDFDTVGRGVGGGGVSLLRCMPCRPGKAPCGGPAFDPSRSSSLAGVACGPDCPTGPCVGPTPTCSLNETDGNRTVLVNGTFVSDTLTLSPTVRVTSFALACMDVVFNVSKITRSSGVLDLSRSRFSLVSRLTTSSSSADNNATVGGFSYCLPALSASSRGFLAIGGALPNLSGSGDGAGSTPLVDDPKHRSSYLIKLSGITVGGTGIDAPTTQPSNLAALEVGTPFTHLELAIYTALRDEFRRQMDRYTPALPYRVLDTCYNFTGLTEFDVPSITLKFDGGATLVPDVDQLMYFVDGPARPFSVGCLAFAAMPEGVPVSVIGNLVQQRVEVAYDVQGRKVSFYPRKLLNGDRKVPASYI